MRGTKTVLKKHISKCLILIIALSFSSFYLLKSEQSNSYITYVYVSPKEQVIDSLNETFIVNVSICNVLDLYGYEFKLFYNSSVINGSRVVEGPFLKTTGYDTFFYTVTFTDHYNSTHGVVWIDSCLIGDVLGANGNGTLVTIEFKSLTTGVSELCLTDVKLVDSKNEPIPYQDVDGSVTVVPELSFLLMVLALAFHSSIVLFNSHLRSKSERTRRNKVD